MITLDVFKILICLLSIVVSVDSPGELDTLTNFTLKRSLGDKISTVFTPLRPYQDFAATVGYRLQNETEKTPVECAPKPSLHYLLTATVEYQGKDEEFVNTVNFRLADRYYGHPLLRTKSSPPVKATEV